MRRPMIFQELADRGDDDLTVAADIDDRGQKSERMSVKHVRNGGG